MGLLFEKGMNDENGDDLAGRLRKWAEERVSGEGVEGLVERLRGGDVGVAGLLDWLEFPPREGVPGRLGRFELVRVIAEGGMGVVVEARDTLLERRVALKLLKPELWVRPDWRERFLEEARAMALVDHPAVLPVYEVVDTGEEVFFVMPLVEGGSLQDFLDGGGRMVGREGMWLVEELCGALRAVHVAGLVHGDLKPGNVLFDADRKRVWLADFGIVSCSGGVGRFAGTPEWMAPERVEGVADVRSDWYELGKVLCAATGGRVDGRIKGLLDEMVREDREARLCDGDEVLRRIRRGRRRRRAVVAGVLTGIGVGLVLAVMAVMAVLPMGVVGGLNRVLAEVWGGRIWIEGRIGTFGCLADAIGEARGRGVVLDFDGAMRVKAAVLEGRGTIRAGAGHRPVLVPERVDRPLWRVRGEWRVEGVRFERETAGVGVSLIEVGAGGKLEMAGCVVWDRETLLRGREAGSVVRMGSGSFLKASDGMILVDGRAWLVVNGGGVELEGRNLALGGSAGVVVMDGGGLTMAIEDCTILLGRFLVAGEAKVIVEAKRCLFVNAVMMVNRVGGGLAWNGMGNVFQGRGGLAPGVRDPESWSEMTGVEEGDFRVGELPMPIRGKNGREQLEKQVIETHLSWPVDLGAGANVRRLPWIR